MGETYVTQWKYKGSIIRRRGNSFQVETNLGGRRRRVTQRTRTQAEAYAREMATSIRDEGADAVRLSGKQRFEAAEALRLFPTPEMRLAARDAFHILPHAEQRHDAALALSILSGRVTGKDLDEPKHSPLAEAARFWVRHHPEGGAAPSIEEALAAYLVSKAHRRPETRREMGNKLGRFCRDHAGKSVAEVTSADIDGWLTANIPSLGNKRKHLRLLHAFYVFIVRKWGLAQNPADRVYLDASDVDEVLPEAYSVDDVEAILGSAAGNAATRPIVPALCVGFFAGLRPAEIRWLEWPDVDFAERHIRVRPETAKRRRQRFVEMSDNLVAWLTPHRCDAGHVSPPEITYRRLRAVVLAAAGVPVWLRDGLRHSFASYHLAMHSNPAKTAFEMGHQGHADVLYQHYRKLVGKSDAERYWSIRPQAAADPAVVPSPTE